MNTIAGLGLRGRAPAIPEPPYAERADAGGWSTDDRNSHGILLDPIQGCSRGDPIRSVSGPFQFREGDPTTIDFLETDFAEDDLLTGPAEAGIAGEVLQPPSGGRSDLWLYRDRTVGLLRRYMRLAIEVGRLPSLLGREFFRTRVTSYHTSTFEDAVIFVHDVERSLENLDEFEKKLIAKIVLQEYSQEEAGRLLGCGLRTAARRYAEALDRVSEIFLEREILARLPVTKTEAPETCQEGETEENFASDSEQGKNNGNNYHD